MRLSGACRGAAFVAIVLLFLSAGSHILATESSLAHVELAMFTLTPFIPALVFLGCVLLSYGRFRKPALVVWFLLALPCAVTAWSQSQWGDGMMDGSEALRLHYGRYSFLAACLFAYGSTIILLASLVLIIAEWRRPTP